MPRIRMSRFVFVLAALLVTLQFMGVIASGHAGNGSAPAPLEWSTTAVVDDPTDESATCGDVEQIPDPNSLLAGRDRHRPTAGCDTKPSADGARRDRVTAPPPGHPTTSHVASRSTATHSPESLQTFRR
ncbi:MULTISPECIES: hypothetical protein [Streptomyces]|uniref:Secreted protein n=1 Tax=Streptomyces lonegramiae TaxID=3075524 RepID=A0ABU2XVR0_9ACTN|nr:hypothetical protein [Streptomyces sp. DSM 41529]MDT0549996.1 hypothetical protein [Streptomyces sp. DSM 41529]